MKVLVTGGAGFIGSHMADRLIDYGEEVIVIDSLTEGRLENINKDALFMKMDIRDYKALKNLFEKHEFKSIFHFAGSATTKESSMGWDDPITDYEINAVGTLNLLRANCSTGTDARFVYASSAAVYGEPRYVPITENHPTDPVSPYGISKLSGEKYCSAYHRENGTPVSIVRIFNTFGSRQPRYVMYDLIKKLNTDPSRLEVLGTGEQCRDYAYISDTIDAFFEIWNSSKFNGEIFNVAGDNHISIRDLSLIIVEVMGVNPDITFTGKSWKGDISDLWADISKIKEHVGWEPKIPLRKGIEKLYHWLKLYEHK